MTAYTNSETGEERTSKYNSAIDQIYRFGIIWRNAYKHVCLGDFNAWNLDLDTIWRELSADVKPDSGDEKEFNLINKKIMEVYPFVMPTAPGFNKVSTEYNKKVSKQYLLLNEKEIFLRRLLEKSGKGGAKEDSDEDDF